MRLERRGLGEKRGGLHGFDKIGQEDGWAWGMAPGALFHELLGLGLNWEVAAN